MRAPTLVLASTSVYRRDLLARLDIAFEVAAPDVDETPLPGEQPQETALRLAKAKAISLADRFPDALIIGSDQVATMSGEQIGKPLTHERAVEQLRAMRGKAVTFHSALALHNSRTGRMQAVVDPTIVNFRKYDDRLIDAYLLKEKPYNCAGSAKVEGLGILLIESMQGKDPSSLIGLPLIDLVSMLNNEQFDIL